MFEGKFSFLVEFEVGGGETQFLGGDSFAVDDNRFEVYCLIDRDVGMPILILIIFGLLLKGNDEHLAFGTF